MFPPLRSLGYSSCQVQIDVQIQVVHKALKAASACHMELMVELKMFFFWLQLFLFRSASHISGAIMPVRTLLPYVTTATVAVGHCHHHPRCQHHRPQDPSHRFPHCCRPVMLFCCMALVLVKEGAVDAFVDGCIPDSEFNSKHGFGPGSPHQASRYSCHDMC